MNNRDTASPAEGELVAGNWQEVNGESLRQLPPELSLADSLKPLAAEIASYRRELPRLLQDGEAGRFAVIRGGTVYGTWDTYRDASQYAREKFLLDQPFMVQRIDARDPERL